MTQTNAQVTFKGSPLTIGGKMLREGDAMPDFSLVGNNMSDFSSEALKGKIGIISVVPSLDTPVCSAQTKYFNRAAEGFSEDVIVLTVSLDLPFAQVRWCGAEGCKRLITASDYKYRDFGNAFGVWIEEWGLLARAVFVVDRAGTVRYVEYVSEISAEPDYNAALAKVSELCEE